MTSQTTNDQNISKTTDTSRGSASHDGSKRIVSVDWERYAQFLENEKLTEEQKQEFLETLWNIIVAFVELGYGVHPIQEFGEANEKLEKNPLPDSDTVVQSS